MQTLGCAQTWDTWCSRKLRTCPSHRLRCKLLPLGRKFLFPILLPQPLQWRGTGFWTPGAEAHRLLCYTGVSTVPLQCHGQKQLFYCYTTIEISAVAKDDSIVQAFDSLYLHKENTCSSLSSSFFPAALH